MVAISFGTKTPLQLSFVKTIKTALNRRPRFWGFAAACYRRYQKIGQLMLNKGKWNGKQVISEEWIETITTPVIPPTVVNERYGKTDLSPYQFSYGYLWWFIENFKQHPDFEGAYTARGWGGQYVTVLPKLNIVVAHKCNVSTLVRWGLRSGGVTDYEYWDLLYDFIKTQV